MSTDIVKNKLINTSEKFDVLLKMDKPHKITDIINTNNTPVKSKLMLIIMVLLILMF